MSLLFYIYYSGLCHHSHYHNHCHRSTGSSCLSCGDNCYPQVPFRSGGVGVLAEGERQVYEEVGRDEEVWLYRDIKGGSGPTYMEVGEGGGKTQGK